MVFFICSHCGASLKKNKVEKHYAVQCRNAPLVSCMDCHKEFRDNDYVAHTKCITEDEKYSAKGFVPKPNSNKGECKQQEWLEVVRGVQSQENLPKCLKIVLDSIVKFENIPRKKPKFLNFLKSNHIKISPQDLDQLWELLEKEHKRAKENGETPTTTNKVTETKEEDSSADLSKDSPKQNGDLSVEVIEECEATPKDKSKKKKRKSKDVAIDINGKEAEESLQVTKEQNEALMDVDHECEDTTKSNKKKKRKTETTDGSEAQENENLQAVEELNKSASIEVTPKEKTKKKKNKKENKTEVSDDIEMHGSENIQISEKQTETTPLEVGEESRITPKRKTKDDKKETETEVVEDGERQVHDGQQKEVILTKKQKKEKKKREKYEAELKEIENSHFNNQPLENDDGQNRKKKKSKKDKDVNGLDSNANSVTEVQAEEMSVKPKKKRHLDDDQSAEPLKKKKKKEQGDEPVEEVCPVESSTTENAMTEITNGLQKFKWNEAILEVVRSKGGEIPVKRLRKKVVAEFQNCHGSVESEDNIIVKFNKKLCKVPGVIVHKEVVKLVE